MPLSSGGGGVYVFLCVCVYVMGSFICACGCRYACILTLWWKSKDTLGDCCCLSPCLTQNSSAWTPPKHLGQKVQDMLLPLSFVSAGEIWHG